MITVVFKRSAQLDMCGIFFTWHGSINAGRFEKKRPGLHGSKGHRSQNEQEWDSWCYRRDFVTFPTLSLWKTRVVNQKSIENYSCLLKAFDRKRSTGAYSWCLCYVTCVCCFGCRYVYKTRPLTYVIRYVQVITNGRL